jgi:hypothetical protein
MQGEVGVTTRGRCECCVEFIKGAHVFCCTLAMMGPWQLRCEL